MQQQKVVILYSGGLDSTVLLHLAIKMEMHPTGLLIDYGQKNIRELETAARNCHNLGIPFRTMKIDLSGIDSGLTGDKVGGKYEGVSEWYVPGRNTIFIGLAFSLAESIGAKKIWYGANYGSRVNQFKDCYQEYVISMNDVLSKAGSYPIILEAPLGGMLKETVKALAATYGIGEADVHSGYHE